MARQKRQKLTPDSRSEPPRSSDVDWKKVSCCATINITPGDDDDDDDGLISIGGGGQPSRHLASSSSSTKSLLGQLLAPLDVATFLDHCFRSYAVHGKVPRRQQERPGQQPKNNNVTKNRYQSIIDDWLYGLDPQAIYRATSSESIFVWLQQPDTGRIHSIEVADAETAYRLYKAGHATYCRAPPALEQTLVGALLADTGLGHGQYDRTGRHNLTALGRGEVEVFLSRTAGHVTDWHYDFQENFTFQLSGIKRWTVQKGTVRHPLRACTPHYDAMSVVESQVLAARLADPTFQFGPPTTGNTTTTTGTTGPVEETIELHPGDVFYFPAGMWHKIEVVEPGVSINVSLMATNYATVTCQALQHLLLQREEWRECLQDRGGGTSSSSSLERLQSLLETLPEIVRDFAATHGAGAIFPPCTLLPTPSRHEDRCSNGTNQEPMEADDGEEKEVDDEAEDDDAGGRGGEEMDDDGDDEDDEAEEEPPIVVSTFEAPMVMPLKLRSAHRLVVNPLASLVREQEDILQPFDRINIHPVHEESSSQSTTLLLNVNFAGNEAHESLVRQRLVVDDETVLWDMLKELEKDNGSLSKDSMNDPAIVRLVDCLVHFGYLQWKKN
jgi:hypothetical protein